MNAFNLSWNSHSLEIGKRTLVMGVLNVTPDSFSDGGIFFNFDDAVAHGEKLVKDILINSDGITKFLNEHRTDS